MKLMLKSKTLLLFFVLSSFIVPKIHAQRKKDFKSIELKVDNVNDRYPGKGIGIGVVATLYNGKKKETKGYLRGKIKWKEFDVKVSGGAYSDGRVTLLGQASGDVQHDVVVEVISKDFPNLKVVQTIRLNYKGQINAFYSGEPGQKGEKGDDKGTPLIWTDGNDGEDGGLGGDGGAGANVNIYARLKFDTILKVNLIDILIESSHRRDEMFLVNPEGGTFNVYANGGQGGSGGDGGDGGSGKDARAATSSKKGRRAGDGGDGGMGGNGGAGGDGGEIYLFLSPEVAEYQSLFRLVNNGGPGGLPGDGGRAGSGGSADGNYPAGNNGSVGQKGAFQGEPGNGGPSPVIKVEELNKDW